MKIFINLYFYILKLIWIMTISFVLGIVIWILFIPEANVGAYVNNLLWPVYLLFFTIIFNVSEFCSDYLKKNNIKQFKAFQIWYYKDLQDVINQFEEQIIEQDDNPKNICVCIWDNTIENVEAQRQMLFK